MNDNRIAKSLVNNFEFKPEDIEKFKEIEENNNDPELTWEMTAMIFKAVETLNKWNVKTTEENINLFLYFAFKNQVKENNQ